MNILIDENIPYGREAFEALGAVETAPGRGITREMLLDKDMLLVRSITKVNEALLSGTPVKFVATATIGEDHIDKTWLREQGIGFSSAPGCNANSVSEYITAALLVLAERHGLSLPDLSLGIVGLGNVGTRVLKKSRALGMRCVVNDPPLAESTCEP
ncbi:MAG: 4-phosphoerythronate dehydrogenase, partial [Candidatus Hydrogenedentes bacterium]|nr:4-phosphoerythronate dehydrogenase [Candidatus Hydrogenedentota bacterium]